MVRCIFGIAMIIYLYKPLLDVNLVMVFIADNIVYRLDDYGFNKLGEYALHTSYEPMESDIVL